MCCLLMLKIVQLDLLHILFNAVSSHVHLRKGFEFVLNSGTAGVEVQLARLPATYRFHPTMGCRTRCLVLSLSLVMLAVSLLFIRPKHT